MFHQSISMFPSARIVYTNSLLKTLFQRHRHIHWLTFNVELRSIGHFLSTICALYPRYLIKGEYSSCGTIPFRFELFSDFCLIMHVNTYFTDELIYYNFQNKLFLGQFLLILPIMIEGSHLQKYKLVTIDFY